VVGATVRPASALAEERLHWRVLNYLWWLEGEALSSAGVCGACYAFKREKVLPFAWDADADDIHVALAASARGYRVRICRAAHATEVRVPQTASELVQFRLRRGADYLFELLRSRQDNAPVCFRIARLMRLWHFLVTPKVGVGLAVAACVLLWTEYWSWSLLTLIAFAAPVLAALLTSTMLTGERRRWWKLTLVASRLFALTLVSMLMLNPRPSSRVPLGGKS
jgi:cellulose synthase/poly-beta-1,6-N-acetylglucosamine synthase-like glycosyltransferase